MIAARLLTLQIGDLLLRTDDRSPTPFDLFLGPGSLAAAAAVRLFERHYCDLDKQRNRDMKELRKTPGVLFAYLAFAA